MCVNQLEDPRGVSRQIYAVPDLCCIVSRRLVELVGGVFDPLLSPAMAVFEQDGCVHTVWTGCGQRQCTPSRQQVARDETEEPLLWPYRVSNLDAAVSRRDRGQANQE